MPLYLTLFDSFVLLIIFPDFFYDLFFNYLGLFLIFCFYFFLDFFFVCTDMEEKKLKNKKISERTLFENLSKQNEELLKKKREKDLELKEEDKYVCEKIHFLFSFLFLF